MIDFDADGGAFLSTGDFGVEATDVKTNCKFVGIFDNDFQSFNNDIELSGSTPAFLCRTVDIPNLKQDDVIKINDISYTVRDTEPDGTGMTQVILKR